MFRLNSAAAKLARKACLDVEAATGTKVIRGPGRVLILKWMGINSLNFSRLNCL